MLPKPGVCQDFELQQLELPHIEEGADNSKVMGLKINVRFVMKLIFRHAECRSYPYLGLALFDLFFAKTHIFQEKRHSFG